MSDAAPDPASTGLDADWRRLEPLGELIALFLPPSLRRTLPAWGLLLHEIESAALDLSEAHIAAIKLAWWRDELVQAHRGAPRHPLTQVLQTAGWMQRAPEQAWVALAAGGIALSTDLEATVDVEAQLRRYGRLTEPAAALECRLFGGDPGATARLHAVHLALEQWLRSRRRERQPWPLDLVARHGASPSAEPEAAVLQALAQDHARRLRAGLTAAARSSAYRGLASVSRVDLIRQLERSGRPGELVVRPGPLMTLAVWRRCRAILRSQPRA